MVDIEIKGILEHLPHDNAHLDLTMPNTGWL
jgi:hypothetical protein